MLYLLDTSVLITANNQYYPIERVPEFWGWLYHQGTLGLVKMPLEFYEEVKEGRKDEDKDSLLAWIKTPDNRNALVLDEEVAVRRVAKVIDLGYADDLTDDEVEQLGRDPFLIAYGLADAERRCIVTTEVSRPSRKRHNRHIPDVCRSMGIRCVDTFGMLKALDFKTSWKP